MSLHGEPEFAGESIIYNVPWSTREQYLDNHVDSRHSCRLNGGLQKLDYVIRASFVFVYGIQIQMQPQVLVAVADDPRKCFLKPIGCPDFFSVLLEQLSLES